MTSPSKDETQDPGSDAEFERVVRNLVNTPHKPHEKKKPADDPEKAG